MSAMLRPFLDAEAIVALMLPRSSVDAYAAQIGTLRAGAAYTSIDLGFPDGRIRDLIEDSQAAAIVTDGAGAERVARLGFERARVILPGEGIAGRSPATAAGTSHQAHAGTTGRPRAAAVASRSRIDAGPSRGLRGLAYVIYTSGTTGRPKGVMVEHGAIANLISADVSEFRLSPSDRVGQGSSHAYDSSIEEIWLALASGAAVVVLDDETVRAGPDLVAWLDAERISVLCPPPTLLRTMGADEAAERLRHLALLYVGGEALPRDVADTWSVGRRLVNGYGPTECAVTALRGEIRGGDPITIGRPISGISAYVVNDTLEEVPPGERGELCLGGAGLARGYWNDPDLTEQKFPTHARFGRIYRTGDLVHRGADGSFFFHGRVDSQVKLRGHRLELEEIESHLARCAGVRAAACRVQTDGPHQELMAFVVATDPDAPPDVDDLRAALERTLPAHAIPHRVQFLESLPTAIGGKLDRAALPEAAPARDEAANLIAARDVIESTIEKELRRLLQRDDPVSTDRHFFMDLGGDSLRAAELVTALRTHPETRSVAVRDVYEAPTIRELSDRVRTSGQVRAPISTHASPTSPGVVAEPSSPRRKTDVARRAATHPDGKARQPGLSGKSRPLLATALQAMWLIGEAVAGAVLAYAVVFDLVPRLLGALGLVRALLLVPVIAMLAAALYTLVTLGFAVLVKRCLIGRYTAVRAPIWGAFYVRNWLVQQAVRAAPWSLFAGTEFQVVALRALGARIGQRVHLHRGVDLLQGGWDLLEIGDDVVVGQDAELRLVELDAGDVVVGPIFLGREATLDVRAGVSGHTRMEDGAYLTSHSNLPAHGRIPAGERWDGIPAQPAGVAPPRPEISSARGRLTPWQYGAARLAADLAIVLALALPIETATVLLAIARGTHASDVVAWVVAPEWNAAAAGAFAITLAAMPLTVTWSALVVRAIGRLEPGVISRWSWDYLRVWTKTGLLQWAGDWLSGTLFWPWWLRASGMTIGQGCEISTIIDVVPELIEIGRSSFLADGIYLGGPRVHRGTVHLAPTRLGDGVFIGNHAVIPAGQDVAANVLIGISTVANESSTRADTRWFGHPPFELPLGAPEGVAARRLPDRRLTHDPTPIRYVNRLCWEWLRCAIPMVPLLAVVWWTSAVASAAAHLRTAMLLGVVVILSLAAGALVCAFVLALKWVLLGRVAPGEHPLWSCWCSRWDFLYVAWAQLARPLLAGLEGTLLLGWYLRAMGARIGRRVAFGGGFAQMVDPDMLQIDDEATVHALFQAHTFEDRVLKIDRIRIGRRATVGHGVVLLYGSDVGAEASVAAGSVVMKRERLTPGRAYAGCPTREIYEPNRGN